MVGIAVMQVVLKLLSMGVLVIGCVPTGMLRARAAFDLKCPEDQLELQELGSRMTQGVNGCGRSATYVLNHDGTAWMMDSSSSGMQSPERAK